MKRHACAIACIALAAMPARAATAGGIAFPDAFPVGNETLHINGAGVRVFFAIVKGYASALYVRSPSHQATAVLDEPDPKVLVTRFLHGAGLGQLKTEFANVHDHFCARNACPPANEASYHEMLAHLAPVARGETATYVITETGMQIFRDDKLAYTIDNPAYARNFLAAIIGPTSPTPGYRAGLLGKG